MKRISCIATLIILLASVGPSLALRQPGHLESQLRAASGKKLRAQRTVTHAPTWASPAWRTFSTLEPGTWRALWDADTRVPLAIYGSGIDAPGTVDSSEEAERQAHTILSRHLDLFAPGARPGDFLVTSNRLHDGVRAVVFTQFHRGIPVLGGAVSFSFVRDRLVTIMSTALPHIDAPIPGNSVADLRAERRALEWMRSDGGADDARVSAIEEPVIVSLIGADDGRIEYVVALVVTVATEREPGLFHVFIDAGTGAPVAKKQRLFFGASTMFYDTPVRWPGGTRQDNPALFTDITVDGAITVTDIMGRFTWNGTADAAVVTRARGPYVRVANQAGGDITGSVTLPDGVDARFSVAGTEFSDAQLTTFIHTNLAKEFARTLAPGLGWLEEQLLAQVNINQACNAFYDPQEDTINFFIAGTAGNITCGNTGRLPDVVYHEFGHALHNAAAAPGITVDAAFSEGASDYFAATIQDDPAVGIGFYGNNEPLRHIDPPGTESSWPQDVAVDPHITGLIFAEAMWDLRSELIVAMGEEAGVAYADRLFYAALRNAADIPSSYVAVLTADDDDGNLANGTPVSCLIDNAFDRHGLATGGGASGFLLGGIDHDGREISFVEQVSTGAFCADMGVESAVLEWQTRDDPNTSGTVSMASSGDRWSGSLPFVGEREVLRYRVLIRTQDGETISFPRNPADPMYEMFQGGVVPIYCLDFESDPFAQGWTSGSSSGVNDWQWGSPGGGGGDPGHSYSGTQVLGNNLQQDGRYSPESTNYVDTPIIDVSGYDNVRLQYKRWLYVEDGFWDHASIFANGDQVWTNADSQQGNGSDVHHTDQEWRFHDIDVTNLVDQGRMQIRFSLESDQALEFGGWTLDDVCLVAYAVSICGDGVATSVEECDQGVDNSDVLADACRTDCVAAYCGDGIRDTGESCDDGNNVDDDDCDNQCVGIFNAPLIGGCCQTSGDRVPPAGSSLLWCLTILGAFVVLRRRRKRS